MELMFVKVRVSIPTLIILLSLTSLLDPTSGNNPGGNYNAPPPSSSLPPHLSQQQQQQQQYYGYSDNAPQQQPQQQQQQQQNFRDPGQNSLRPGQFFPYDDVPARSSAPSYPYGSRGPPPDPRYRQAPPPSPQQEGIMSRLKQSIATASSALLGSFTEEADEDLSMLPSDQRYLPPPTNRAGPPSQYRDDRYAAQFPRTQDLRAPPGRYSPPPPPSDGVVSGFFGKIKSMLSGDEQPNSGAGHLQQQQQQQQRPRQQGVDPYQGGRPRFPPPPPPSGWQQRPFPSDSRPGPPAPLPGQVQGPRASGTPPGQWQPAPKQPTDDYRAPPPPGYFPQTHPDPIPGVNLPDESGDNLPSQSQQPPLQQQPQQPDQFSTQFPYPDRQFLSQPSQQGAYAYPGPNDQLVPPPALPVEEAPDPLLSAPTDPLTFAFEDSIVLILKPREFYRKKMEMIRAGPGSLQVLSDFEHVFTRFRLGPQPAEEEAISALTGLGLGTTALALCASSAGSRTVGSAELLESSPALAPSCQQRLQQVTEAFEQAMSQGQGEEAAFEELTARCQAIVATEGALQIASLAPVTRDGLPRLGLRTGWKEVLSALSSRGVPAYIFSSGYGDVVAQALLLSGLGVPTPPSPSYHPGQGSAQVGQPQLPPNLRIISNFFRTGPDGTVRAFSQPVVHERNKNASTAARVLGMPLPNRPHAVLLAAHEDDPAAMVDGMKDSLRETLSIGFLELGDDLPQRLPAYLSAFDAVVLGDGSLQFTRGLLEDLLSLPRSAELLLQQQQQQGGLGGLLKKGLWGKFLGGNGGEDGGASPLHAPPPAHPAQASSYPPAYHAYPPNAPPRSQLQGQQIQQQQQQQDFNAEQNSKSYLHYGDF